METKILAIALLALVFLAFAFYKFSSTAPSAGANDVLGQGEHGASTPAPTQDANSELKQIYDSLPPAGRNLFYRQSEGLTKPVDSKLVELDNKIITCAGGEAVMKLSAVNPSIGGSCIGPGMAVEFSGKSANLHLGGQCCGALKDTAEYYGQIEAMKKYTAVIPEVPPDPYDIPIELAQKWIKYDSETALTSEEQKLYDEAMGLSDEGGPCCCKCWHWDVNSGIAKKMIKEYKFTAQQIADFWDESEICGA